MTSLVTTDEARRHLRLTESNMEDEDIAADVADKMVQATGIVVDFLKQPEHEWTAETVPATIKAAILIVLGRIYEDREDASIPENVKDMLWRNRDPALA
jgi:hypothetical protein